MPDRLDPHTLRVVREKLAEPAAFHRFGSAGAGMYQASLVAWADKQLAEAPPEPVAEVERPRLDPHTLRDAALVHLHATVKALVAENVYEANGELHCRSCLPSFTPGSDLHAPDCLILKLTQALGTYTPRAEAPPETGHTAEDYERWYREGVAMAQAGEPIPTQAELQGHWQARGFQWFSANLDRQALKAEVQRLVAALRAQQERQP